MPDETEPTNTPYPQQRTPEQHAAVRRKSLPIAFAGAILGVAGLAILLAGQTPAVAASISENLRLLAVNLSFCAMMIGIGILFYAKGTRGTRGAVVFCVVAIVTGLIGPLLWAMFAVNLRAGQEARELQNASAIAHAAATYAADHAGAYPPDLAALLAGKYLTPETLHCPFPPGAPILTDDVSALLAKSPRADVLKIIDDHSDYEYYGTDLHLPSASQPATAPAALPHAIIVAAGKFPVLRTELAIAYADGSAEYITLDDAQAKLKECNEARKTLGLPELRPLAAVEKATTLESTPGN